MESDETTGPATTEVNNDIEMELDLIQTAPTMPSHAPNELYFTVTGYDIKVWGYC
jgi:hypothetical protein